MKTPFLLTLFIFTLLFQLQAQYSLPYSIVPTLDNPEFLGSTDIDGDGFEDMIGSSTDNEKVFWAHYVENGDYFDYPVYIPFPNASPGLILGSDIDQNGRNDLIVFDDTGKNIYLIENTDQQGNFSLPQLLGTHPESIEIFSVADINDDGFEDIVFTSQFNETIYAFVSNGSLSYSEVVISTSSFYEIREIKTLDIDQDGKIDIAISKDEGMAWFRNLGDGTFTEYLTTSQRYLLVSMMGQVIFHPTMKYMNNLKETVTRFLNWVILIMTGIWTSYSSLPLVLQVA